MLTLPNSRVFVAYGTGNIYTDRWLVAPVWRTSILLPTNMLASRNPYHVQVAPVAEAYLSREVLEDFLAIENPDRRETEMENFVTKAPADGVVVLEGESRTFSSILKIRIRWMEGNSRLRSIDMDLGAGIDVVTPPANWVQAEVLIPDPDSSRPTPDDRIFGDFAFMTAICARGDCLPSSGWRQNSVRYTDTAFMSRVPELGLLTNLDVDRKRSTQRVTATSDAPIASLRTVWNANLPGRVGGFGSYTTGTFSPQPAGGNQISINDIPGSANQFSYALPLDRLRETVSIIQELTF